MNCQEIINKFELQVDDATELSTTEELALLNKVYNDICNDRSWEFLKKEFSITTNGTNNVSLPTDFGYFLENSNDNIPSKNIRIGLNIYKLINWSDRNNGTGQFAYIDLSNNKLYFSDTPANGLAISADYVKTPAVLLITDSPIFSERFHNIIPYLMSVEDYILQQTSSAESRTNENKALANNILTDMRMWNANLHNL